MRVPLGVDFPDGPSSLALTGFRGRTSLVARTSWFWTNGCLGFLRQRQQPRCVQINAAARIGKNDRPGETEAIEQPHAQFTFQSFDVMRHAGLRIVKLICGTTKAHGGYYRHKRFEVLQVKHNYDQLRDDLRSKTI